MPNEAAATAVIETFELTRRFGGPTPLGLVQMTVVAGLLGCTCQPLG